MYQNLYNISYVYRMKTSSIYEDNKPYIFEVFIVQDDAKLAEFNIMESIWKETLILAQIQDQRCQPVLSFG
jgi:hypothetical protein